MKINSLNLLFVVLMVLVVTSLIACRTPPATNSALESSGAKADIRTMLDQYFAYFNDGQPEAIPGVWHVPGWVAVGTRNQLLADDAAVSSFYKAILDTIEAEGYDHSDILTADITISNEACATIDFTFTRWNTDGEIIPPRVRPVSCVVLKNDGRWGINTLIFTALQQDLRLSCA